MPGYESAKDLLDLSRMDYKALRILLQAEESDSAVIGFHAQQAIEKSLKAWLELLNVEYQKTHNLRYLLLLLEQFGHNVDEWLDFLELSPFAVQYRYEIFNPAEMVLDWDDIAHNIESFISMIDHLLKEKSSTL